MAPEILAVCQQLLKSGKTVSVGMLKSRLPSNTPLPAIIHAVQYCKQQPKAVVEMDSPNITNDSRSDTSPDAVSIAELKSRIDELEKRLFALEQKS